MQCQLIDPESIELPLHNGSSNCYCLHHSCCFATAVYFMPKVNLSFHSNFVLIGDLKVNVLDISSTFYQTLYDILSSSISHRLYKNQLEWHHVVLMTWSWFPIPVVPPLSNSDHNTSGTVNELDNCCSYIPSLHFWQVVIEHAMKYRFWLGSTEPTCRCCYHRNLSEFRCWTCVISRFRLSHQGVTRTVSDFQAKVHNKRNDCKHMMLLAAWPCVHKMVVLVELAQIPTYTRYPPKLQCF